MTGRPSVCGKANRSLAPRTKDDPAGTPRPHLSPPQIFEPRSSWLRDNVGESLYLAGIKAAATRLVPPAHPPRRFIRVTCGTPLLAKNSNVFPRVAPPAHRPHTGSTFFPPSRSCDTAHPLRPVSRIARTAAPTPRARTLLKISVKSRAGNPRSLPTRTIKSPRINTLRNFYRCTI